MTDGKALDDIIRKIDEFRETFEAYMLEINKDIQHLYAKDLHRGDQIDILDTRVEDLEKRPNEARILATNTYESEGRN